LETFGLCQLDTSSAKQMTMEAIVRAVEATSEASRGIHLEEVSLRGGST
jgi:hypothetical protein